MPSTFCTGARFHRFDIEFDISAAQNCCHIALSNTSCALTCYECNKLITSVFSNSSSYMDSTEVTFEILKWADKLSLSPLA